MSSCIRWLWFMRNYFDNSLYWEEEKKKYIDDVKAHDIAPVNKEIRELEQKLEQLESAKKSAIKAVMARYRPGHPTNQMQMTPSDKRKLTDLARQQKSVSVKINNLKDFVSQKERLIEAKEWENHNAESLQRELKLLEVYAQNKLTKKQAEKLNKKIEEHRKMLAGQQELTSSMNQEAEIDDLVEMERVNREEVANEIKLENRSMLLANEENGNDFWMSLVEGLDTQSQPIESFTADGATFEEGDLLSTLRGESTV